METHSSIPSRLAAASGASAHGVSDVHERRHQRASSSRGLGRLRH